MDPAFCRLAQKEDREGSIDQEEIFHGVALFLATITARLFSSILGTDDAPFGPVMRKRGAARAAAEAVAGPAGMAAAATPRRCARAARERAGASPRPHNAARNAGRRT